MYQVSKRDGAVVDFDIKKISTAIKKAFEASKTEYNDDIIDFIALKVTADFSKKIKDGKIAVEDISAVTTTDSAENSEKRHESRQSKSNFANVSIL